MKMTQWTTKSITRVSVNDGKVHLTTRFGNVAIVLPLDEMEFIINELMKQPDEVTMALGLYIHDR